MLIKIITLTILSKSLVNLWVASSHYTFLPHFILFSLKDLFYIPKQANVIPSSARVTVNHRVHPSNTIEEVITQLELF